MNRHSSLPTIPSVSPKSRLRQALDPLDFQKQGKYTQMLREQINSLNVDTFIHDYFSVQKKPPPPPPPGTSAHAGAGRQRSHSSSRTEDKVAELHALDSSADISTRDLMSQVSQLQELSGQGVGLQNDKVAQLERQIEEVFERQKNDAEQFQVLLQESIARALDDVPRMCEEHVARFCKEYFQSQTSSQDAINTGTLESNHADHRRHQEIADLEKVWACVQEQEHQLRSLEASMQEQIHEVHQVALRCLKDQLESIPELIGSQIRNVCQGLQNVQILENQNLVNGTCNEIHSLRAEFSENLRKVQQQGAAFQRSQMEEIHVARRMAEIAFERVDNLDTKMTQAEQFSAREEAPSSCSASAGSS